MWIVGSMVKVWALVVKIKIAKFCFVKAAILGMQHCWVASVPGLPRFYLLFVFHNNTWNRKIGKALTGKAWEHPSHDVRWVRGGRGGGPNCQNNAQDHLFEHSITFFGLQTLVWWKVLILTGKKLAFKFNTYISEYRPLPCVIVNIHSYYMSL